MKKFFAILTVLAVMAGCKSTPTDEAPVESRDGKIPTVDARGVDGGIVKGNPWSDPSHPLFNALKQRSVFFDYDSDAIKSEYVPVVEAHARALREYPQGKILIQGNADERGSREYNLALGQRRADAIKSRLTLLGAKASQVESTSLGEEKPRCSDASESCYSQNRRGDFVPQ